MQTLFRGRKVYQSKIVCTANMHYLADLEGVGFRGLGAEENKTVYYDKICESKMDVFLSFFNIISFNSVISYCYVEEPLLQRPQRRLTW